MFPCLSLCSVHYINEDIKQDTWPLQRPVSSPVASEVTTPPSSPSPIDPVVLFQPLSPVDRAGLSADEQDSPTVQTAPIQADTPAEILEESVATELSAGKITGKLVLFKKSFGETSFTSVVLVWSHIDIGARCAGIIKHLDLTDMMDNLGLTVHQDDWLCACCGAQTTSFYGVVLMWSHIGARCAGNLNTIVDPDVCGRCQHPDSKLANICVYVR
jgi:hypothetical protein